MACVEPFSPAPPARCTPDSVPPRPRRITLQRVARARPIANHIGGPLPVQTTPPRPNPGFLHVPRRAASSSSSSAGGDAAAPRRSGHSGSYTGSINGGQRVRAATGTYSFGPATSVPGTALGSEMQITFDVQNQLADAERQRPAAGAHGARSVLRHQRVRGTRDRQGHQVRQPAEPGHHPDLLVERRAGLASWSTTRRPSAVTKPGTSATGTTRWSPAGCTSITSKRVMRAGSADSPS